MNTDTSTDRSPIPQSSKWGFLLWLVAAFIAVALTSILLTAGAVRHVLLQPGHRWLSDKQAQIVISVAAFPSLVISAFNDLTLSNDPNALLLDRQTIEQTNWVRRFPASEDSGYLLFSGVNPVAKKSLVQLIRIADGYVMAQWDPDWREISDKTSEKKWVSKGSISRLRAVHPLLLADGDIIFNTGSVLVRLSNCSSRPIFVLDQYMHHSVELDENGSAMWVPSATNDAMIENEYLNKVIRDDSLAHVSLDGRVLENRSFARILIDNGFKAMLLGHFGATFDPIHLNQIQVAQTDGRHWLRGDLLISARQLSTIFLYRPSINKIIWHQTGPWLNQHSAEFVGDHSISIFNNNVMLLSPKGQEFITPSDTNGVMVYDFDTKQVTEPFAALLSVARPLSIGEGRARILPDGGLFFEETQNGRQLRFSADRLMWSRINDYDDKRIGMVSWSRYLTANEASRPLKALLARRCPSTKSNP